MKMRVSHEADVPSYSHMYPHESLRGLYVTVFFSLLFHHQCNIISPQIPCERLVPDLNIDVAEVNGIDVRVLAVLPTQLPI